MLCAKHGRIQRPSVPLFLHLSREAAATKEITASATLSNVCPLEPLYCDNNDNTAGADLLKF